MSTTTPYLRIKFQNQKDWLDMRRRGIGGSDAGALMGLNPYRGPLDVYYDKVQGKQDSAGEAAYWGTVLEASIAKRFAELHPDIKVTKQNCTYALKKACFIRGNLDRALRLGDGEKAGLEIKTANPFNTEVWADNDVPASYYCQVQHYMMITGFKRFYMAILIGGQHYIEREIPRNDDFIAELRETETRFWVDHVLPHNPPKWDGSNYAWQMITELYPSAQKGKLIDLSDDSEAKAAVEEIGKNKGKIKQLKSELAKIELENEANKQIIAAAMQDADKATIGAIKISYPSVTVKEHTVAAKTYRRMSINFKNE